MDDNIEIGGLHHVTAVTGRAAENLAFYTHALGMRLVKKTVNQDDLSAYHLFYADAEGSPGTEVTFFDWPHAGPNRPGVGEVSTIALRIPDTDALNWWADRLQGLGVAHEGIQERNGKHLLVFSDPEGQRLALVADPGQAGGVPWTGGPVPAEMGILGLHSVSLALRTIEPTVRVLTEVLGFRQAGEYARPDASRVAVYESGPGGAGTEVYLEEHPQLPWARTGIGGVHHVAFRAANDEQHQEWQERVSSAGIAVTPVIDRFYFRSIYFREPGGVLFEIATDGPGFAADEDPAHLGEKLSLPPFLEGRRAEIEAGLRPIEPVGQTTGS